MQVFVIDRTTKPIDAALMIEQIRAGLPELVNWEVEQTNGLPWSGNYFMYCQREDGTAVDLYLPDEFTDLAGLTALINAHNPQDAVIGAKPPFSAEYLQAEASRKQYMEVK